MRPVSTATKYAKAFADVVGWDNNTRTSLEVHLDALIKFYNIYEIDLVFRGKAMPQDLKKKLLDYGMQRLKTPDSVKALLYTLLKAKRLMLFACVVEQYKRIIDEKNSITNVEITTHTKDLGDGDFDLLQEELKSVFGGKKVKTTFKTDAQIFDGMVLKSNNRVLDLSLRSRIKKITTHLGLEA